MNGNTGQLYPTMQSALADLGPTETADDIVQITGNPSTVARISRSVQQTRAVEARRASNKRARQARKRNR